MKNPKAYFDTLIDWKQRPSYKLEPRIDSLVDSKELRKQLVESALE